jgi:hypothetical protein
VTTKLLHEELKKKDVIGSNENRSAFIARPSEIMIHTSSID